MAVDQGRVLEGHTVGVDVIPEIRNGVDGWYLYSYEWFDATGVAKLTYERIIKGKREEHEVTRLEPMRPGHEGWTPN